MRKVNQFENNSVAAGRINNVEMSNGSSQFWNGFARLTEAYSRLHMEAAEKKYLAGLDLHKNEEINRIEQANPNDPDALREQLTESKNAIASTINSDEIRHHFETGFDMQSITPVNRAMAGKQAILDAEFETTLHADINTQRDMAMKGIPDVLKGDPSALINIRNANVRIGEMFNATHADGRPVFSPETRANALTRIQDDFYSDYIIAAVKNSKSPAQAIKQFKNGAVALDFPNDDGSFENVNVREAMSYDAAQRVDSALDAYMKQLEAEARMRRLELMASMADLTAQAMINQDASQVRALGNRVGGSEGANILRKADALDYGFELSKIAGGLPSISAQNEFLAEIKQQLDDDAAAGRIEGLEYKAAAFNNAVQMVAAKQKEMLADPAGYSDTVVGRPANDADISQNSIASNIERRGILGLPLNGKFISDAKVNGIKSQIANAADTRGIWGIAKEVSSQVGNYAPGIFKQVGLSGSDASLVSFAKYDRTAENTLSNVFSAKRIASKDMPDNADSDKKGFNREFNSAWNRSDVLSLLDEIAAGMSGSKATLETISGLKQGFSNHAVITGSFEALNVLDDGFSVVSTSNIKVIIPKSSGVTPVAAAKVFNNKLNEHKADIENYYAEKSRENGVLMSKRKGESAFDNLVFQSDVNDPGYYYVVDLPSQRPLELPGVGFIGMTIDELQQTVMSGRLNDYDVSYAKMIWPDIERYIEEPRK